MKILIDEALSCAIMKILEFGRIEEWATGQVMAELKITLAVRPLKRAVTCLV